MNKELKALQSIKQLQQFPAYLKICNELEVRIQELDEEIIGMIWEWKLKYTSLDLKRVERMILQQFIELPVNLIQEFDAITETIDKEED